MEITTTTDAAEVWDALTRRFVGDPAVCNWMLSAISANAVSGRDGFRYWVGQEGGAVSALAVFSGASSRLDLAPMDSLTAAAMAAAVFGGVENLGGVLGPAGTAAAFAGRWSELANVGARPTDGGRVLEVEALRPPDSTPAGEVRPANLDDLEQLVEWNAGFAADTEVAAPPDPASHLRGLVQNGSTWMWQSADGPESMSIRTAPVMGTRRLAHVYTPPAHRGRGLAAALVAHLAGETLAAGDRCMLHTQLSNSSSNGVYRRLGFEAISESTFYEFLA